MAMARSALGRVSRRLYESAAPSAMCRRGPEILQAPPLPWMPRTGSGARLMRTFTSPAIAAAAARTHRVPNLQGQQHFPVLPRGTYGGMRFAELKRFLSGESKVGDVKPMELARRAIKGLNEWLNGSFDPRNVFYFVMVVGGGSLIWSVILCRSIDSPGNDGGGKALERTSWKKEQGACSLCGRAK